ncbi:MAG: hypothetical protein A2039_00440 [Candidatus Melainabacteria bacterium GWA2_34_9]|nr:MAG: hypothetical protein A2039_00440 [Candidatus Melainabacteria bacterium GWA2_34_9]
MINSINPYFLNTYNNSAFQTEYNINIPFGVNRHTATPIKKIAKHCAYCGQEMFSDEGIKSIIKKMSLAKGADLLDELIKLKNRSTPKSIDLVEKAINLAKNEPTKTGQEISNEVDFLKSSVFEYFRATAEHIMPFSIGGKNSPKNFLAVCCDCNQKRDNKDFKEFISGIPNIVQNFKQYFKELSGHYKIKGHDYSEYMSQKIEQLTGLKIDYRS